MSKCGCYAQQARYTDELEVVYCPLHKAAPELLEAVKDLLPNASAFEKAGLSFYMPDWKERIENARVAIKKAEVKP